ncbi:TetR/AcrR family transcriptional regulator [Nonomuraea sp. KC401]|uniref:TetR/AcrR family transcriptional regulator n=1 Tax=unclassified Nonomuraea TaxID=2593643 RepID=UPI0010FD6AEF|nr:TetR/AcrR family transcriptional regulator [Nonomuraea sp. KC401]NBE97646.1 TetR family transcriptional regulator [Nonomuraea sp. K271]TLF63885.1 TetR/AcrR family transcriptional regulator [Nonomuraea sp. KC401]
MADPGTAERIVAVARRILVEEGSAAVSMRRVGDAAGITAMAIYRHYPNREALLRAVANRSASELAAQWRRRSSPGDLGERISAALDDFLDFALGDRHLFQFLILDAWTGARRFPEDFRGGQGPPFTVLTELVEEGMRTGLLREDDVLEVTLAVTSCAQGLVQQYLNGRMGMDEDDFRALCQRSMWRIVNGLARG